MLPAVLPAGAIELRRCRVDCLQALLAAIAASLAELGQWMPWAQTMPTAEDELAVLVGAASSFDGGSEWRYLLFELDSGDLVGGAGLHPRVGPQGIEIGYWVRSDRTGRGYATAAAQALTDTAFTHLPEIQRVEIHMDSASAASAAVPRKLGYRLDREETCEILVPGDTGTGLVWILDRPT
jgi:RimJ/RimL family protein N-acetyltransferase